MDKRIKTGTMMFPHIIKMCDDNLKLANVSSRNDFIEKSIKFYAGFLNSKDNINYLNGVIEITISNKIDLLEHDLSKTIFKMSVEISMMMNIIAATHNIDNQTLKDLRSKCIKDVKESSGKISFDDIIEFQNIEKE